MGAMSSPLTLSRATMKMRTRPRSCSAAASRSTLRVAPVRLGIRIGFHTAVHAATEESSEVVTTSQPTVNFSKPEGVALVPAPSGINLSKARNTMNTFI